MTIDASEFRAVLGHFASGVVLVTGMHDDRPAGFTCQSFFSLSLAPPLVALAPGKSSTSWPRLSNAGRMCANVLAEEQEGLAMTFAVTEADKICRGRLVAGHQWRPPPPRLSGVDRLHHQRYSRRRGPLSGRGRGRRPGVGQRETAAVLPGRISAASWCSPGQPAGRLDCVAIRPPTGRRSEAGTSHPGGPAPVRAPGPHAEYTFTRAAWWTLGASPRLLQMIHGACSK